MFPSHLEINFDTTPVEREINPSHERIKRVQFKREIENSIQQVAEISAAPSNLEEGVTPAKVEESKMEGMEMINTSSVVAPPIQPEPVPIVIPAAVVPKGDQFIGSGHII